MQPEQQTPVAFDISDGEEDTPRGEGSRLSVRYHWNTGSAEAFWDKESPSPDLRLQHGCVPVLTIPRLPPATWTPLPPESAKALGDVLVTTSLLEVVGEGDAPAFLLVQEEGMACRPSLLKDLSLADILRSWALLTEDERDAFIDDVAGRPSIPEMPMPGSTARDTSQAPESMFDRFAGFFHAFSRMESRIRDDIANERWRRVELLLFGRKFDSLGEIIGRVRTDHGQGRIDTIDAYVIALCAKQVVDGVRAMATVFERNRFRDLDRSLSLIADLRQDLTANHPDLAEFLPWYEGHFLSRAAPSAGNDA
jgi:hypothetical protein